MFNTIIGAIATIVVVTLILVALLLFIKAKLTPSGSVSIDINGGKKTLEAPLGGDLMHTLADQGIFLPSACGGKANCAPSWSAGSAPSAALPTSLHTTSS